MRDVVEALLQLSFVVLNRIYACVVGGRLLIIIRGKFSGLLRASKVATILA